MGLFITTHSIYRNASVEDEGEKVIYSKHKGAHVKRGGVIVKESDYNGHYAVRFVTESGEEHEYVLTKEQLDRLNILTDEPVGRCHCEKGRAHRFVQWLKRLNHALP